MLSEVKLSNFRIFDDEVTVRFRPITVLIGRNSSGKSTIIKFLLMLQQSTMSPSSRFPDLHGTSVRLGTFSELKNSMTSKGGLGFELHLRAPFVRRSNTISRIVERYEKADIDDLLFAVQGEVPYPSTTAEGTIAYSLKQASPAVFHARFTNRISDDFAFSADTHLRKINEIQTTFQQIKDPSQLDPILDEKLRELIDDYTERSDLGMLLMDELNFASHLQAVRAEPDRAAGKSDTPASGVGTEGRHTITNLHRIKTEDEEAYQFLLPHLLNVAGIESVEFEDYWEDSVQAFARNKTTGAKSLIADFGFGVGQCLPVMVQGAIMAPATTLMVEQPEAQLHPTAQLELGSFFADLWNKRQVSSIIETHSDKILLRLRRLIAQGALSYEDVSVAFFTFDENNRNMPVVKNLDINQDGSMQAGLPMEFFGADIIEGLKLGARA